MSSHVINKLSNVHAALAGGAILAIYLLGRRWANKPQLPHPPGPRPLPIIGNLLDMPTSFMPLTWTKFGAKYGPLTWLDVAGVPFLVVNSIEAAHELLGTRGSIYVDRPRFVMGVELVGLDFITPFIPPGERWKRQRTLLKHALSSEVVARDYAELLTRKARQYVECVVDRPEDFLVDLRRITTESMIELSYGRLEDEEGRDYIKYSEFVTDTTVEVMEGYVVDMVPFLKYLPDWLPGMQFKRKARQWRKQIEEIDQRTFQLALNSALTPSSDFPSCYMINNLQDLYSSVDEVEGPEEVKEKERTIRQSGLTFLIAGVDTTFSSIQSFLLAMMLHPSVQKKIHSEIDSIVGSTRLPNLDDFESLSYLRHAIIENYRWCPLISGGFPHVSVKDDIYEGYYLPKGTIVMPNGWGISRNTKYYSNPSEFRPDRYLGPEPELDPREYAFGFGRRQCPGSELAIRTIWSTVASVLWAFELRRVDGDSTPLNTDEERFVPGALCVPVDFKCQFIPRHRDLKEKLELYK